MEFLPLLSLFVVALSYGATACMLSCMPLLSPILLANSSTRQESLALLLPITAGRITGYTLLSLVAYIGSALIQSLLKDSVLMGYLLGSVTLILALRLWSAQRTANGCCTTSSRPKVQGNIALFATGLLLSLSLCAPVMTMMALSAATPSLGWALLYGLVFGLGATLLWFLFFSVVMTAILKESLLHLQRYRRILERLAPIVLGAVGVAIFNGWIHL
ncbi:MAG: sulfite exporter TauE/SafE family protein [Sulfuricurvum sp.]|uniref:sulfite exporter TauE/SafE family protein n=1 Tax=Sulfuricurvum sp. TaxID=2025608 RepID=UPI0025E4C97E|nr:sulfite exporter TauE/SafE family protein [Sulfuricurvum sp.]MCK9373931.1 sulfite exporter TauE/SafE family protein [Sulfuricurvum sp.]